MAAPRKNQNALGNKGGGRTTNIQRRLERDFWTKIMFTKYDRNKLAEKVKRSKHSGLDAFILKALDGNPRAMRFMFNQVFKEI